MIRALLLAAVLLQAPDPDDPPVAVDVPPEANAGKSAPSGPQRMGLGIGTQQVVKTERPIKAIAVAAPEIADVRPLSANEVLLLGKSIGETSAFLFHEDGGRTEIAIAVRDTDPTDVVAELAALLEPMRGSSPKLTSQVVGDRVYLDGLIGTVEDYQRILAVASMLPKIQVLARLDPEALRKSVAEVNDRLRRAGLSGARAVQVGNTVILEGTVADDLESRKAVAIARDLLGPFFEAAGAPK